MPRKDSRAAGGSGFPHLVDRRVVAGAAAWALSAVTFIVLPLAQAAFERPYSLADNFISDLGNTACGPSVCSPLHALVNGTFMVVGLLQWFGAATTYRAWPPVPGRRVAMICLALAGCALAFIGVFPENVAPATHHFGAFLGLLSLNVGMLLLGLVLWRAVRVLGALAMLAGAIGLVGFVLFSTSVAPGLPKGIAERIADYPSGVMIIVVGVALLAATRSRRRG